MGYEALSLNFWVKTFPALVANVGLLVLVIARTRFQNKYLIFFSLTLILDALVAGGVLKDVDRSTQVGLEVFFVWLHDFRFFYLVGALLYAGKGLEAARGLSLDGSILKPAFLLSLMPTLMLLAANFARPDFFTQVRHQFLMYEIACFALVMLLWMKVLSKATESLALPDRRFLKSIFIPVAAYYGLWAASDILILQKVEYGFLLRIIPNFIYYTVFLWWIYFATPFATANIDLP